MKTKPVEKPQALNSPALESFARTSSEKKGAYEIFAIDQDHCIRKGAHLSIFNGKITVDTPHEQVLSFRKLIAPPYVSSDFILTMRLFGEEVSTAKYTWYPFKIKREGEINGIRVSSQLLLVDGTRTALMTITLKNRGTRRTTVPVQTNIRGGVEFQYTGDAVTLDYINFYGFSWPESKKKCTAFSKEQTVIARNDTGAVVVRTDLTNLDWKGFAWMWEGTLVLAPKESRTFHMAVAVGNALEAEAGAEKAIKAPEQEIAQTHQAFDKKTRDIFARIPELEARDSRLVKFYHRSLLPFLLNKWEVPEFVLNPFYADGGLSGGCIGLYLWDWGNGYGIHPLYDPDSAREHIKQFLKIDLTNHFAFSPDGQAFGPWYPVNQEKMVGLIYHHVLLTGDAEFLNEEVNGRSILDWAIYQAAYRDDLSKPAELINFKYGKDNYIELRRGEYLYRHIMPCLNSRRCESYRMVDALCKIAGKKSPVDFLTRADDIKAALKKELWDANEKWFGWIDDGNKEKQMRYTAQILKMLDTGALDKEEENGLVSHLNEEEFLSEYGLHSISKKDPAYDQDDVDCGGGGICTSILPIIVERLYRAGHAEEAADVLKRTLWWGERLPYYADSQVSNFIGYRHDSPLQNLIGALAGAQCIIYGMFGVKAGVKDITINPVPPRWSPEIRLKGLKIRGLNIDISIKGKTFEVKSNGARFMSKIGSPITIKPTRKI